jgi:GDPmannose 4,6-dehydratase
MSKKKVAIIFGVSGQDGSYLAKFLIKKNYQIIGITRNKSQKNLYRLNKLEILDKIKLEEGIAANKLFLKKIIKKYSKTNEIYYLAGDSSATDSFIFPHRSFESNTMGILNILLNVKDINKKIKVFYAASGQFYGNSKNNYFSENSQIKPTTPYAVAKAAGYWLVKIFRENYDLYACSGILFNHESPLRSNQFVTKKIVNISKLMINNKKLILKLGDINIYRDWGWTAEYVEAMWLMLQQQKPVDLVIGSGKKNSLREFVKQVFKLLKIPMSRLKYNKKKFKRVNDIKSYRADIRLARKILKWRPKINFKKIVYKLVNEELY